MTDKSVQSVHDEFWQAPDDALFSPKKIAIVLQKSKSWLQAQRCNGGGIPYIKLSNKVIYYRKSDVMKFLDVQKQQHT